MEDATWVAWSGFVLGIISTVYAAINHRRIRSNCCGKTIEASVDIEATTPVKVPV